MGGLYFIFVFDKELVKKLLQRYITIFIIKPIVRYTPIQKILNLSNTEYALCAATLALIHWQLPEKTESNA